MVANLNNPVVAAIQMTSGPAVDANLATASRLLQAAADAGACIAVLPENFSCMGLRDTDKLAIAEDQNSGPIQDALASLAERLNLWIVAGTTPLRVAGERRVGAACLVFDSSGRQVARYDKIHLFDVDVDVPGRGESHRESANICPGTQVVTLATPAGRLGLSVCYDLRFPELYRRMAAEGADWFVVPAAFTVPTGRAHWETLLRARAIENQAFLVAPGQSGFHPSGRETYGDSMIVDHWGEILARLPRGEGLITAAFDLEAQRQVRASFPSLAHRTLS